jgi:hypothetical protein
MCPMVLFTYDQRNYTWMKLKQIFALLNQIKEKFEDTK